MLDFQLHINFHHFKVSQLILKLQFNHNSLFINQYFKIKHSFVDFPNNF